MKPGEKAIGVDIGGSHISCAAIDISNRTIIHDSWSESEVNNKASRDVIIQSWASALKNTIDRIDTSSLAGIGFAMPGPFQYEKGIAMFERVEKYESLYNVNVGKELRSELSLDDHIELRFMNDATAFAVGEAWTGKAAGSARSLSITLGSGFGSAFIENGLPVVYGEDVPELGCVWHLPFRESIANDYISTHWFVRKYQNTTGLNVSGVRKLAEQAPGDPIAMELFIEFGRNLAEILIPWLKRFGVEVIVIGGNIALAYPLFGNYFEESLVEANIDAKVKLSELMEHAAILGSARLIEELFWERIFPLLKYM